MDAQELRINLSRFSGSETFTRWIPISDTTLTEGVRYLAEKAKCFWLMDMIESHRPALKSEGFGVAKLIVDLDKHTAIFTLDDGNDRIVATQKIPYTDFPLGSIKLYIADNGPAWTIMLPSEY